VTALDCVYVALFTARRWLRLHTRRALVCSWRGHRFKFGPRCCIRCGKPIPTLRVDL
jgi:hypothetical protein